jgi:hypothetical protein
MSGGNTKINLFDVGTQQNIHKAGNQPFRSKQYGL